jgi:isoleucyl-tRNA synthetase
MSADAMRWLFTNHNPAMNLKFGYKLAEEVRRRFMIPLWNVYSFFVIYANIDGFDPTAHAMPVAERSVLDRWIIAELQVTVDEVTQGLENWDTARGTRALEAFVDNLSNWYVRRSRRRYWKSEEDTDKTAAYLTLYEALATLLQLLAPYTPFLCEEIYQNLVRSVDPNAPESVHLTDWPLAQAALVDRELLDAVRLTRRVVGLGLAARNAARIKVRQPLARLRVTVRDEAEWRALQPFVDQILDELNVKTLERLGDDAEVATYTLRPVTPVLGPRLGARLQAVTKALGALDQAEAVAKVRRGEPLRLTVDGETVELAPDEVQVMAAPRRGYAVAEELGYLAALDTEITPELRDEGLAREFVHRVQTMRKNAGFDIADYITTTYTAGGRLAAALERHAAYVAAETLSRKLCAVPTARQVAGYTETFIVDGEEATVGVERVG